MAPNKTNIRGSPIIMDLDTALVNRPMITSSTQEAMTATPEILSSITYIIGWAKQLGIPMEKDKFKMLQLGKYYTYKDIEVLCLIICS